MKKFPKLYQIGLHYPKTVIAIALAIMAIAFVASKKLEVESDLTALLPKKTESVQNLDELKKYFGGSSHLFVTVEHPDPAFAQEFADLFAARIEKEPDVLYVEAKRPVEYFKARQWLYIDLPDLHEMERRIDRSLDLQKEGVSPVFNSFVDFADPEDNPDLSFKDIFNKYKKKSGIDIKERTSDNNGTFVVIKVKAKESSENIDSSRKFIADIKSLQVELLQNPRYRDVAVGYTGGYQTKLEQVDQIKGEMEMVSMAVAVVLLVIFLIYFQQLAGAVLVGIPLLVALVWTGGFVYWSLGHLNMITGFAAAILAGLGSDFGIYLLSRYYQERQSGCDFKTACDRAFSNTGRATHASMVTNVGCFAALLFSTFGVFVEFGVVGAIGVLSTYFAMMLLLPALLAVWQRHPLPIRFLNVNLQSLLAKFQPVRWQRVVPRLFTPSASAIGVGMVVVLVFLAAFTLPSETVITFNSGQMDNKALPGNKLYERVSNAIESSLDPTILLVRGRTEEKAVTKELRAWIDRDTSEKPVFKNVASISSFVPDDQPDKKEIVARLRSKFDKLHIPESNDRTKFLNSLGDTMRASPVKLEGLPESIKRLFVSAVDPDVFAVYLFPGIDRGDAGEIKRYRDAIAQFAQQSGLHFKAVDGNFVTDDTVALIKKEAPQGLALLLVFLAAVLLVMIRPPSRAATIFLHLLVGLVLFSGVLWLAHVPLNILNISAISIVLGTGIDSFIHFSYRYDESFHVVQTVKSKVPSILVSNLTTVVGFAGLLLTSSGGLRSIGWVAVFGLIVITLLSTLTFPQWLVLFKNLKERS